MSRSFVKNLIWLQALNWLVKPFWILWIERTVQNELGSEWYGTYFVHFNVGLLFAVLLDAGLNSYISREVAQQGKVTHWKRFLYLRLILGLVYVFGILAVSVFQKLDPSIIAVVVINQILASVVLTMRAVLQGRHLFISDGILSVLDRLVAIIICSFLLLGMLPDFGLDTASFSGLNGIFYFLLSQTAGYFIALLFGGYLLRFKEKGNSNISNSSIANSAESDPKSSADSMEQSIELKTWLKGVFWFMAMALSMSIFTRIDALMIRNFAGGYESAGDYAKSYRLLDAALIFSTLLSTQLLPMFSQKLSKGDSNHGLISGGFRLVFWVSSSAFLFVFLFGNDLLKLLYHDEMGNYVSRFPLHLNYQHWVFALLMASFIPMSLIHVFGTFITALGKMKWLTGLSIATMLVNIGLNVWLLPTLGILGAALSCFLSQSFFSGMCFVQIMRNGYFSWTWKHVRMVTMVMLLAGVVVLSLLMYIDGMTASLIDSNIRLMTLFMGWLIFALGSGYIFFAKDVKKRLKGF